MISYHYYHNLSSFLLHMLGGMKCKSYVENTPSSTDIEGFNSSAGQTDFLDVNPVFCVPKAVGRTYCGLDNIH